MTSSGHTVAVIASGFAAGLMSGLLGVGGGVVMVPLVALAAGLSEHEAHGTSLAAVVVMGAVGAAAFAAGGETDIGVAALLALGAIAGAPLGARVMAAMSEERLETAFGILLLAVAGTMLWS
ncbi:MAG: TSUP family transporter [Actinomycetota bacterium]